MCTIILFKVKLWALLSVSDMQDKRIKHNQSKSELHREEI